MSSKTYSNGCCACVGSNKISPLQVNQVDSQIEEVRPGRFLRVQHFNHTKYSWSAVKPVSCLKTDQDKNTNNGNLPGQMEVSMATQKQPRIRTASSVNVDLVAGQNHMDPGAGQPDVVMSTQGSPKHTDLTYETKNRSPKTSKNSPPGDTSAFSPPGDSAVAVFFIHGVGGSSEVWEGQLHYFTELGYHVIAPDLIGHGFSLAPRRSTDYLFTEICADILCLFDKYSRKTNIVIGHSYGSCFAAVVARSRPGKVHRLVMISGGSPTPLAPQPGVFALPSCLLCCCRPVLNRGFKKSAFYRKTCIAAKHAFAVPTYVLKYTMNGQQWLDGDAEWHCGIAVPALLIHGEQDKLISIEEETEMAECLFGSELVVLSEASHMVMMEKSHEVNELIQAFIQREVDLAELELYREMRRKIEEPVQEHTLNDREEAEQPGVLNPEGEVAKKQKVHFSPVRVKNGGFSPKFRRRMEQEQDDITRSTVSLKSARSIPSRLLTHNIK